MLSFNIYKNNKQRITVNDNCKYGFFIYMNMKQIRLIIVFFILTIKISYSQTILNPNLGSQSHPTLKITQIDLLSNQTIVYVQAENKSKKGDLFCADKNIYIKSLSDNKKYELIQSIGIPTCPENYQFTYVGEILKFTLYFPPLPKSTDYIDIIEDCNNYCFSFKGVILNKDLNKSINNAYEAYAKSDDKKTVQIFDKAIASFPDYPYGIIYFNIIKIHSDNNNIIKKKEWINKLKQSDVYDKNYYLSIIK